MTPSFGDIIREWRGIRRFSQIDLSFEAETSARHLSFIESGRSAPSRAMVLKLALALQLPKAIANRALTAAGYAPSFPMLEADAPDLAPVRAAVASMLANHAPLPAIAFDRHWDVTAANPAAVRLFADLGLAGQTNMLDALLAAADTGAIENWEETATLALERVFAEVVHLGGNARLAGYADLLAARLAEAGASRDHFDLNQAIIPTVFRTARGRLTVFSTIAQFGSVQEVNACDIRIEMMFPADEATRLLFDQERAMP